MSGLAQAQQKMIDAGVPQRAIDVFTSFYSQLEGGATGMIAEAEVEPLTDLVRASELAMDDAGVEAVARDRPGTPDNLPLVGATDLPGVFLAAGHYRHGVLLAPLTAHRFRPAVEPGTPPPWLDCDTPADLARARQLAEGSRG